MTRIAKKIWIMALLAGVPFSALAAAVSFSPALGSFSVGESFTASVYVNPEAGETITAAQVSLTFPADKLEVVSYEPENGGNILAHVGTKIDNDKGTIVDNVAFHPGINSSTKVAKVVFKAKSEGPVAVSVGSDTKMLDAGNNDKFSGKGSASYTLSSPAAGPGEKSPAQPSKEGVTAGEGKTGGAAPSGVQRQKAGSGFGSPRASHPTVGIQEQASSTQEAATSSQETATSTAPSEEGQSAAVGVTKIGKKWIWLILALAVLAIIVYGYYSQKKRR